MRKPDIDPLFYHYKAFRMIKKYEQSEQKFYIIPGEGNAMKSREFMKTIIRDPKLAPYDSDNEGPGN